MNCIPHREIKKKKETNSGNVLIGAGQKIRDSLICMIYTFGFCIIYIFIFYMKLFKI